MDAPCEIQRSIHVFRLVNNMCPGKWVHIKKIGMDIVYRNNFIREETICRISKQGIKKQKLEK